ncbi:MAG: hypothetical protein JJU29_18800 [Verrucomicrobia bacterium]|nr:hypothetical protein [Verrucomicrobiota bacterium]MCH8514085.1 hypothetical protein [Kiritimatiellia bacterium]
MITFRFAFKTCFSTFLLLAWLPAAAQFESIWHTPSDASEVPGGITMRDPLFPGVETPVTFYQGVWKGEGANQTGGTFYYRVNEGAWQSLALDFHANADGDLQFWKAEVNMPANVGAQFEYYFFVTLDNRDDTYLFAGAGEDNTKSLLQADASAEPYSLTVAPQTLSGNASLTVNGQNANYNVLNFYIDELQNEVFPALDIVFEPGAPTTQVEIFTNLNNRDRANLDWDGDGIEDGIIPPDGNLISVSDTDAYFQAYTMADEGDGTYTLTLPVEKTGAYRLTARFRDGEEAPWSWIGEQGIRDLAIVVAPKQARDMVMYELHVTNSNATGPTFAQRGTFEDLHDENARINLTWLREMGVNWIWFQPFHPQGIDGREIDPDTGSFYDPGSPYSIRDFWQINPLYTSEYNGSLSDSARNPVNYAAAMQAFQDFAAAADEKGVYLMLDFPFNHTAPDVVLADKGIELFAPEGHDWQPNDLFRDRVPQFFSTNGSEGVAAYSAPAQSAGGIAVAPDRNDFGKWEDVRDVYFGRYATLVTGYPDAETSRAIVRNEEDWMDYSSMGPETINVWRYFGAVLPYWIEQSGHRGHNDHDPEWDLETRMAEDAAGIDGLRKDFGQGLPPQAMEYIINVTHSHKWNFVFMSESLDGGEVTYRSSRHFTVLNENIVFPLKDATTTPGYRGVFEDRRNAYGLSLVLLNNLSHDEEPYADPWQALIRYATVSTNDGAPMIMYGQEIGAAQKSQEALPQGSWDWYELNFGKDIPHFKKWNSMQPQWTAWDANDLGTRFLRPVYAAIGQAREFSPALRSPNRWFLNRHADGVVRNEIFSVAKYTEASAPLAQQDVVLGFTNLDRDNPQSDTFGIPVALADLLGLADGRTYNVKNIAAYAGTPGLSDDFSWRRDVWLWGTGRDRADIIANGVFVSMNPVPNNDAAWVEEASLAPYEAQFLKVYDVTPPPAVGAPANANGLNYTATGVLVMSWDTSAFGDHDNVTANHVVVTDEGDQVVFEGTMPGTGAFTWEIPSSAFGSVVTVSVTPVSVAGIQAESASPVSATVHLLDPEGDEDNNGMSNFDEYIAGTNPFDAEDVFASKNIALMGGKASVSLNGVAGRRYQLQYSEDFLQGVAEPTWHDAGDPVAVSENEPVELEDPEEDPPSRVYRITVQLDN